jgi:uncharacterized membrane protein
MKEALFIVGVVAALISLLALVVSYQDIRDNYLSCAIATSIMVGCFLGLRRLDSKWIGRSNAVFALALFNAVIVICGYVKLLSR